MNLNESFLRLMQEDPFLLMVGASLLIVTPPLVGLVFWVTLFQGRVQSIAQFLRRVLTGAGVALLTAIFLVWLGGLLFQPSNAESFFALIFILGLFGLLGSGWLDW